MMDAEIKHYYERYLVENPEDAAMILGLEAYTDMQKMSACAECAYYIEHGALPSWGYVIADVERVGDSLIFIYTDMQRLN